MPHAITLPALPTQLDEEHQLRAWHYEDDWTVPELAAALAGREQQLELLMRECEPK